MRSLEERLKTIRDGAVARIPQEHREVMHAATHELEASGASERALAEGGQAPDFALDNSEGTRVELSSVLRDGPLVLTFFRGHW